MFIAAESPAEGASDLFQFLGIDPTKSDPEVRNSGNSRPTNSLIAITSLDGRATVAGVSAALGNPTDAALFNTLRGCADAIVVGANTVRVEQYARISPSPALASRRQLFDQLASPPLMVLSRSLDFELSGPFVTSARPILAPAEPRIELSTSIIFTKPPNKESTLSFEQWRERRKALTDAGLHIEVVPHLQQLTVRSVIEAARAWGFGHLVIEGGPSIYAQAIEQDVVDEIFLTVAPFFVGTGPHTFATAGLVTALPHSYRLAKSFTSDSHIFLRYLKSSNR